MEIRNTILRVGKAYLVALCVMRSLAMADTSVFR